MSYTHARKTYKLAFEGAPEFEGLEVTARGMSVGQYLEVTNLAESKDVGSVDRLLRRFADALVSWNVKDEDGTDIPNTYEGVASCDIDFIMRIIAAWMTAIAGVSKDLGKGLSSTGNSLELALPMEAA
jgi:hypothetical protein